MSKKNTISTLRNLFLELCHEQNRVWFEKQEELPISAKRCFTTLINTHAVVREDHLRYWFPRGATSLEVDFSCQRAFLYMPPLTSDNEFVPLLSVKCIINSHVNEVRLRVKLVKHSEEDGFQSIGFRLDSPENEAYEDGQPGLHDFYHAQFMVKVNPRIDEAAPGPHWLPCHQPSFPVLARNPETLAVSLLLSLYGKDYSWEFYRDRYVTLRDLGRHMKEELQPWIGWKGFEEGR